MVKKQVDELASSGPVANNVPYLEGSSQLGTGSLPAEFKSRPMIPRTPIDPNILEQVHKDNELLQE